MYRNGCTYCYYSVLFYSDFLHYASTEVYSNLYCSLRIMYFKILTGTNQRKFRTETLGRIAWNRKGLKKVNLCCGSALRSGSTDRSMSLSLEECIWPSKTTPCSLSWFLYNFVRSVYLNTGEIFLSKIFHVIYLAFKTIMLLSLYVWLKALFYSKPLHYYSRTFLHWWYNCIEA